MVNKIDLSTDLGIFLLNFAFDVQIFVTLCILHLQRFILMDFRLYLRKLNLR